MAPPVIAQESLIPHQDSDASTESELRPFSSSPMLAGGGTAFSEHLEKQFVLMSSVFFGIPTEFVSSAYETDARVNYDPFNPYAGCRNIVVGDDLLKKIFDMPYSFERLIGVMAHELAHCFQLQTGTIEALQEVRQHAVKFIELHADYMAGQALAWRAHHLKSNPDEVALMFFEYGDENLSSRQHHGTPRERLISFVSGYHDYDPQEHQPRPNPLTSSAKGILYIRKAFGF